MIYFYLLICEILLTAIFFYFFNLPIEHAFLIVYGFLLLSSLIFARMINKYNSFIAIHIFVAVIYLGFQIFKASKNTPMSYPLTPSVEKKLDFIVDRLKPEASDRIIFLKAISSLVLYQFDKASESALQLSNTKEYKVLLLEFIKQEKDNFLNLVKDNPRNDPFFLLKYFDKEEYERAYSEVKVLKFFPQKIELLNRIKELQIVSGNITLLEKSIMKKHLQLINSNPLYLDTTLDLIPGTLIFLKDRIANLNNSNMLSLLDFFNIEAKYSQLKVYNHIFLDNKIKFSSEYLIVNPYTKSYWGINTRVNEQLYTFVKIIPHQLVFFEGENLKIQGILNQIQTTIELNTSPFYLGWVKPSYRSKYKTIYDTQIVPKHTKIQYTFITFFIMTLFCILTIKALKPLINFTQINKISYVVALCFIVFLTYLYVSIIHYVVDYIVPIVISI